MPLHDIDAILDRTDLEALADELCGARRGHGSGTRWPSPVPGHPQTGRTPPMSIFTDRRGRQRWTCWATGTSGTAIDLVSVSRCIDVSASIQWLADRAGSSPDPPTPRPRPHPARRSGISADLREYVNACVKELRKPSGSVAREWLMNRQLNPAITDLNEVGYDPGPTDLRRARGLPFRGAGIVLPTFDRMSSLVYAQTRYFDIERAGRKYDNPSGRHASKPSVAWPRLLDHGGSLTVVCEGVIDALTVAGISVRSVALLSASDAKAVTEQLARAPGQLVIAMDPDAAGRTAGRTLEQTLADSGITGVRHLGLPTDVNDFACRSSERFERLFKAALRGVKARTASTTALSRTQ